MREFEVVPGVVARRWTPADAPAVAAVIDRERDRLARWMPFVPHSTRVEESASFIAASIERFEAGTGVDLGIFDGADVVGGMGGDIDSLNRAADIGYWLAGSHQRRGIAGAAVAALIDRLVAGRSLHRISIRAAVGNTRSRAVAERLGFTFEGVLRESLLLEGRHEDAAVYSLLAPEWKR